MGETLRAGRRTSRWVQACAAAIGVAGLVLAYRTTTTSLEWIGRTFPGFVFLDNRVVAAIGLPGWSGASVPDLYLNEIRSLDGKPVGPAGRLRAEIAGLPPGIRLHWVVQRDGPPLEAAIETQRFTARDWVMLFGAYLLNGTVFLGSGLLAWLLQPRSPLARAMLAFGASCAVFLFTAMDLYGPSSFFALHMLAETLVPAAALQLLLLFPQAHRLAGWRFAGYPVAAALFALLWLNLDQPLAFLRAFDACALLLVAVSLLFGLRQGLEFWRASSALARQRVRVVTVGTIFGLALPGIIVAVSRSLGSGLGMNTIAFTFFLFPISLAYAIVKHDLFEIDAMVKRGGYYLLLTGAVGGAYAGAVFVLNLSLQGSEITRSAAFPLLFTLGVLLLFNPLRARLQGVVDRVFFRTGYDGARVLAAVGGALASALRHDEISRLVRDGVDQAIPNLGTRLFFADGEDTSLREVGGSAPLSATLCAHLATGQVLSVDDRPEDAADAVERAAARDELRALGTEVAVPMLLQGRLVGLLTVGAKRSGLFYTAGDAEFLRALAHQAATALQNASSYEALARLNTELEQRVRNRTAELAAANADLETSNAALERAYGELKNAEVQLVQSAKMASLGRLAAGVAHEINNPVSFIASNIDPLRARLERAQAAPQDAPRLLGQARDLLDIMAKGAARTVAVVRDLSSFSRLNEATRKAVDLREGLDVSIRLLEARWRDRIAIHRDYQEIPPVECEAGQINQVFMNLLANACDAIAAQGDIWVGARRAGGHVIFSVRDNGCGMPPEKLARIFDPFFTTKDVGQGTGLGLAIVHGIVTAHGGRIEVDSAVGQGSEFRVVLPIVAAAEQAPTSAET